MDLNNLGHTVVRAQPAAGSPRHDSGGEYETPSEPTLSSGSPKPKDTVSVRGPMALARLPAHSDSYRVSPGHGFERCASLGEMERTRLSTGQAADVAGAAGVLGV